MTEFYIVGRNDGRNRVLHRVPKLDDHECGGAWEPVDLELEPGRWVRQIVATDRIRRRKDSR